MKINIKCAFLSIALLFIGLQMTQGQSKAELENELNEANATIDSISLRLANLEVMYSFVKDSIVKNDFDPTKIGMVADSLNSIPDSAISLITAENIILIDSLSTLSAQNEAQNQTIDNCVIWINAIANEPMTREEIEKGLDDNHKEILSQLGQLKELLDDGILTQQEFDAKKKMLMDKW